MAKENNNNFLMGVIFLLLIVIAVGAFFYGKNMGDTNIVAPIPKTDGNNSVTTKEAPTVMIISDTRCGIACETDELVGKLKQIPALATAEITQIDYSEKSAKDALTAAGIKVLPAAIFSNNGVTELATFLKPTSDFKYSLELGSTYDPTIKRSDKGFTILSEEDKAIALKDSHFIGAENGKIVWLEYTDVNCHFCKKMETDGTAKAVLAKFPNDLRKTPVNFVGVGGAATQTAAEIFECIAKIGGAEAYNTAISKSLTTGKNSASDLYGFAKEAGADSAKVEACHKAGEAKEMVAAKFNAGKTIFGVSGTPGNILLNTETGEYELISGAYPEANFVAVIERMLK